MNREERGRADSFLDALCLNRKLVLVLFSVAAVMLLLSFVSFAVVEPGTATYVVVVLNLIGLGGFTLLSGGVLVLCRDRV